MASSLDKFFEEFVRPLEGRTLIVGSSVKEGREDRRKLYDDVIGLDMEAGDGVDLVHDMETPVDSSFLGSFAHVECTSVLEHSRKPWLLAANVESVLQIGGTLLFSAPFVWRQHSYPSDYFRFTADGIRELFPRIEWEILTYIGAETSTSSRKALRGFRHEGHPFLARCEVYGFGSRRV